jgi:hypothetical protein
MFVWTRGQDTSSSSEGFDYHSKATQNLDFRYMVPCIVLQYIYIYIYIYMRDQLDVTLFSFLF